jgi:hypothetical protein
MVNLSKKICNQLRSQLDWNLENLLDRQLYNQLDGQLRNKLRSQSALLVILQVNKR